MAERTRQIKLSKLPEAASFGLNIALGLIALAMMGLFIFANDYLWARQEYVTLGELAAVFGLPLLLEIGWIAEVTRRELRHNQQLPAQIAKCRRDPLPAADYEKFLEVAREHPEIHGWIAEALNGRNFMTRDEAEGLAAPINTYLVEAPRRELTALVANADPSDAGGRGQNGSA